MTSQLATRLEATERAERTAALRRLLAHPLVCREDDAACFAMIVRHRNWLAQWFAEHPGWNLVIEPASGFARLHKVPARPDATRPARLAGKPPFDRRRYVLLCLALAALDDSPGQTTLARLAGAVEALSGDDPDIERFDPNTYAERRAFVDVLRWLDDAHVLSQRDGDAERYAHSREGDALYDVNDRLLGQMIAAPVPPALADDAADNEPDEAIDWPGVLLQGHYPDTEDGKRLHARHTVLRMLLDDPVIYYEDLESHAYSWLDRSRGFIYRLLEDDAGLRVERRKEGLAAVDPAGEVSDMLFPDGGSTVKHAALLLAEQLAALARGRQDEPELHNLYEIDDAEVTRRTAALMDDYGERCHWSKQYPPGEEGAARLAADALDLLAAFGLVARTQRGWRPRPAIARFTPAPPRP